MTDLAPIAPLKRPPAADAPPAPDIRLVMLPLDSLRIDRRYQRHVSRQGRSVIRRIVTDFSWSRFGALSVATCGGETQHYAVIDGQHRAIAARTLGIDKVPCVVCDRQMPAQAMDFVIVNSARTRVVAIDRFRARVAAGDQDAVEVARMLDDLGISTDVPPGGKLKPRQTRAVSAIERATKQFGPGITYTALEALLDAQPEQGDLLNSFTIQVTTRVILRVIDAGGSLDAFTELLADTDFTALSIDAAQAVRMFGNTKIHHGAKMLSRAWNRHGNVTIME